MSGRRAGNKTSAGELAYQRDLTRVKSVAGALKVKKKRKRINQEQKALEEQNYTAWLAVNRRKRIIARPMSKANKAGVILRRCHRTLQPFVAHIKEKRLSFDSDASVDIPVKIIQTISQTLVDLSDALDAVTKGIGPMAMAMKKCELKQQDIEERLIQVSTRSHDLNRALMKACQEIFNSEQMWLYANNDFANEILPTSMYHLKTWESNKRARKQREAAGIGTSGDSSGRGLTAGNAPSSKPSGKSQTNAKRSANKERQDMGESMVDHVPVCVADPTSYAGLAGVMANDDVDNVVRGRMH